LVQLTNRRHRFPTSIIQHAIWLYLRFTLSCQDVGNAVACEGPCARRQSKLNESGSHPTLRWRELDSNHRFRVTRPIFQCRLWLVPRQPKSRSENEPTHEARTLPPRNRWFESGTLQRGVRCEPDFSGRMPSMAVGDVQRRLVGTESIGSRIPWLRPRRCGSRGRLSRNPRPIPLPSQSPATKDFGFLGNRRRIARPGRCRAR